MIRLAELRVYPVKSLRGIALQQAEIRGGRLAGDREWLVADGGGRFMHQRDYPQMARVQPRLTATGLELQAEGWPPLLVDRPGDDAPVVFAPLWRRLAPVRHVSAQADAWLSAVLGVRAHLLAFAAGVPARGGPPWETDTSLQDATPFHLTSDDSLQDLNRRSGKPVPMNRFRPNLVVSGAAPYAEDAWQVLRVGVATFRWIKPCTRCKMTTTDQETGERPSSEPLRTLATYRRSGSEVVFGHYLTAETSDAVLGVGDEVRVLEEGTAFRLG